jgi:hypothetical protein
MTFDLDEDELKATRKMNKADRNEIEVGEYVRTEKGLIAKYLGFEKDDNDMEYNKHLFDNKIYWYYEYYNEYVYDEDWKQFKGNIVKHSKQLIDLVEVGDYVNGELITDKWDTRISSIRSNFSEEDIKTILTKEIYMANCYKVGGEE